jgi:hypothetical protein
MRGSKEIKERIKNKIWERCKGLFYNQIANEHLLVQNINYNASFNQRRVLISYLNHGFFSNLENNPGRTVLYEIFKIVKVFSELGFAIDVINCNDTKSLELIRNIKYDLLFGFGEVFYLKSKLQPKALSIIYMTEQHPEISFREESKRAEYFFQRHKKPVQLMRSGMFYKINHLGKKYDYVITLSDIEPLKNQYPKTYAIFPTGILNKRFSFKDKNHTSARKHFLWLGSTAVIHKGLDLLIDVFRNRQDTFLHICGLDENARTLLKIPDRENIIDYGYVDINSSTFLSIVEMCSYSILPSCAEGCATSITTSMLHGLIPVVIKDTGFNRLADKVIFIEDYRIQYLHDKISVLADEDPVRLMNLSREVYDFAQREFTLATFEKNFKQILKDILGFHD